MSIEGQGHFFTIYFPGFVCFVLFLANISGESLLDHWSSVFFFLGGGGGYNYFLIRGNQLIFSSPEPKAHKVSL